MLKGKIGLSLSHNTCVINVFLVFNLRRCGRLSWKGFSFRKRNEVDVLTSKRRLNECMEGKLGVFSGNGSARSVQMEKGWKSQNEIKTKKWKRRKNFVIKMFRSISMCARNRKVRGWTLRRGENSFNDRFYGAWRGSFGEMELAFVAVTSMRWWLKNKIQFKNNRHQICFDLYSFRTTFLDGSCAASETIFPKPLLV